MCYRGTVYLAEWSTCCGYHFAPHEVYHYFVLFFSGEGDNIRVYVRVRPPDKHLETDVDRTPCLEVTSGNTVVLQSKPDPKNFSFDHVADINATQVFRILGGFKCQRCCNYCILPFIYTLHAKNVKDNWLKKF